MFRQEQSILAGLFSCLLFFLPGSTLAQDRDPKIAALARELTEKVEKKLPAAGGKGSAISYLVFDFGRQPGHMSQLGVRLADEFSDALRNEPGLEPVERSKMYDLCQREAFDVTVFEDDKAALWAARALGARVAIVGTVELKGGSSFLLHVRAIEDGSEQAADAGEFLEWTKERQALDLLGMERPSVAGPWENVPRAGQNGYAHPECVFCPSPPYPEAATKAKVRGTVLAEVLIGEDGHAQQVRVVQGLPYGLSTSALATLKIWQFKPISGPDGKPTVVQSLVEVTYRSF